MRYTLETYLNNVDIKKDFEKVRQYFLEHGVDFTFNFHNSNASNIESYYDHSSTRYLIRPYLYAPVSKDGTIFAFNTDAWKTGGNPPYKTTSPTSHVENDNRFVSIAVYPYEIQIDNLWKTIAHELMHSLAKKFNCKDIMDNYQENDNPYSPTGNFSQQWAILKPFIVNNDTPIVNILSTKPMEFGEITHTEVPRISGFDFAIDRILVNEGGYVNNPNDPGGETKFGISKRAYPKLDIKNLTIEQAKEIYFKDFWLPIKGDSMPIKLAVNVFDFAVNAGVNTAVKKMQSALGVVADGIIGKKTLKAMESATSETLSIFVQDRIKFYYSLSTFKTFGNGWIRRTIDTLITSFQHN